MTAFGEVRDIMLDTTFIPATRKLNARPLSYTEGDKYDVWQRDDSLRVTRGATSTKNVIRFNYGTQKIPRIVLKRLENGILRAARSRISLSFEACAIGSRSTVMPERCIRTSARLR